MTILQTLMGVIEQKHASSTLILDCDFNDSEFIDKAGNYKFVGYGTHTEPDVNNREWYKITNQLEFEDYRYNCNPDFSVPVISDGTGSDDSYLINPYQIWILAEGWDNLWIEKGSSDVCKLNKIGNYFIYSTTEEQNYDTFNKFFESDNLTERTKSTLDIETDNKLHFYYGKIIQITENSNSIEVVGDINA